MLAGLDDGQGRDARQYAVRGLGNDLAANDVADRGIELLGVDVGLELILVAGELVLDGGLVEVLHPAFLFIDRGSALCGVEQGLGIQGNGGLQVHACGVAVLLDAGVQCHPGVQGAVGVDVLGGGGVAVAASWCPVTLTPPPPHTRSSTPAAGFAVAVVAAGSQARGLNFNGQNRLWRLMAILLLLSIEEQLADLRCCALLLNTPSYCKAHCHFQLHQHH